MTIDRITNIQREAALSVQGQARFMDQGTLKLVMEIPTASRDLSLRYSGSLDRLDVTSINPYLGIAAGMRLESGILHEAAFKANVQAGHATGEFRAVYENLDMAFLDRETKSEKGALNRLKSMVADHLIVRTSNMPHKTASLKAGQIDYTRRPDESFLHFLWFAVRSGMLDLLGLSDFVKASH